MKRRKNDLLLSEHGCPPYIAGYMRHSTGGKREPPGFLPGHDKKYQAEWLRGYDEVDRRDHKATRPI